MDNLTRRKLNELDLEHQLMQEINLEKAVQMMLPGESMECD